MMTPATVPKTDAQRDHAFTLDTGETVVVNVSKLPTPPSADAVAIHLATRMVDPTTGDTIVVGSSPVTCEHTVTVLTASMAEGLDFAAHLSNEIALQANRVRATKAALTSLAGVAAAVQTSTGA